MLLSVRYIIIIVHEKNHNLHILGICMLSLIIELSELVNIRYIIIQYIMHNAF